MWLLQVKLVAMVNYILSINRPKLVTQWNSRSTFSVLYVCAVSLYLPVTVSALSVTQPVILQLVSVERMNVSIPPLSSPLCLSLSLVLSIVLFCPTFLVCSSFLVHESLNCSACVWNRVWWRSIGKVHLSDDGVFLLLLPFSLGFFCLWSSVFV